LDVREGCVVVIEGEGRGRNHCPGALKDLHSEISFPLRHISNPELKKCTPEKRKQGCLIKPSNI